MFIEIIFTGGYLHLVKYQRVIPGDYVRNPGIICFEVGGRHKIETGVNGEKFILSSVWSGRPSAIRQR